MLRSILILLSSLALVSVGLAQAFYCEAGDTTEINYTDRESLGYFFRPLIVLTVPPGGDFLPVIFHVTPVYFADPNQCINYCIFDQCQPSEHGEFETEYLYPPVGSIVDSTTEFQLAPFRWDRNIGGEDSGCVMRPLQGDFIFDVTIYRADDPENSFTFRYTLHDATLGAEEPRLARVPESFGLTNYPNPFNASTRIRFVLTSGGDARVAIYDLLGREVAELLNAGYLPAGSYETAWPGRNWDGIAMPSGQYLVSLQSRGRQETRPVVLLR